MDRPGLILLHRWQSRLRCKLWNLHDRHCHHELTSGWVIEVWTDPAVTFATYTPAPETMTAKHAAPRKTLLQRLKAWWIERQVTRDLKAGKYHDPITERRRRAKAARFEE